MRSFNSFTLLALKIPNKYLVHFVGPNGFTQKDLANELNIKSSRTSEIILKIKELYKKGGIFNIAKNLIKIEQKWLNNIKNDYLETKQTRERIRIT